MTLPYLPVAVGILINDRKELLIAKRPPSKSLAGYWEFPGGKLEEEESASQALVRELQEELGINIDLRHTTLLGKVEHFYPEFIFQATIFLCAYWTGNPRPLEGQELVWLDFSALNSYKLLESCKKIVSLLEAKTDLACSLAG